MVGGEGEQAVAVCVLGDAIHPTGPPSSSCPDVPGLARTGSGYPGIRASPSARPLHGCAAVWMAGTSPAMTKGERGA